MPSNRDISRPMLISLTALLAVGLVLSSSSLGMTEVRAVEASYKRVLPALLRVQSAKPERRTAQPQRFLRVNPSKGRSWWVLAMAPRQPVSAREHGFQAVDSLAWMMLDLPPPARG